MNTTGENYRITFLSKNVKDFNSIFATLLEKMIPTADLPDFKVSCNNERIVVMLPARSESFSFIAKIVQKIDQFSIVYVSNKDTLNEEENIEATVVQKNTVTTETVTSPAEENIVTTEAVTPPAEENVVTLDATSPTVETNTGTIQSKIKKDKEEQKIRNKQIRGYMLTLKSFTRRDLKKRFPEASVSEINNALMYAKNKGWIMSTGRGKYIVKEIT